MDTFTIHLPDGGTAPHLGRDAAVQALADIPGSVLEPHQDPADALRNAREVADMHREVVDIWRARADEAIERSRR